MKSSALKHLDFPVGEVDVRSLIIFPQPRKVFDEIDSLKESIIENGVFSIPIVALLGKKSFEEYIAVINELWGTNFEAKSFSPLRDGKYHVLIAGERRTRAWRALAEEGKVAFTYLAHIKKDIPVLSALFIQSAENTQRRIPPDQEAYSYNEFYRVLKKIHPGTTLAKFARSVGRSSEVIRNALRFCELPGKVRVMVGENRLHYSVAVELWRLQQAKVPEVEIERWMFRAIIEKRKGEEFRKMISDYIFVREQGQISLFDTMSEEQQRALHQKHRRRVVEERLVPIHSEQKRYFEMVTRLLSEGLLGEEDSPYSSGSPARRLKALITTIKNLQPHLDALVGPGRQLEIEMEEVLSKAEAALSIIEARKSSP